ncbi:hypothetical protein LB572_19000 [Mesorhizobium sp. BH1-1-5]|nr:hypothetical protein [Mesorhizobium sp. BH1-1-5]
MGTKRKRSGSLGLTEPSHHNFPEYSDLGAIFTPKNEIRQNDHRFRGPLTSGGQQKTGRDRSQPV